MDAAVVAVLVREGSPGATPATSKKKAIDPVWLSLSVATLVFFSSFFFFFLCAATPTLTDAAAPWLVFVGAGVFLFFFLNIFHHHARSPHPITVSKNGGPFDWRNRSPQRRQVTSSATLPSAVQIFFSKFFLKLYCNIRSWGFIGFPPPPPFLQKKKKKNFKQWRDGFPRPPYSNRPKKRNNICIRRTFIIASMFLFLLFFINFRPPPVAVEVRPFFFSLSSSLLLSVKKKMQRIIGETLIDRPRLWLTTTSLSIAGARVDVPKSVPKSADVTHKHTQPSHQSSSTENSHGNPVENQQKKQKPLDRHGTQHGPVVS